MTNVPHSGDVVIDKEKGDAIEEVKASSDIDGSDPIPETESITQGSLSIMATSTLFLGIVGSSS